MDSASDYCQALDTNHNEHFVKTVFIPYMTDVFKDLAERAKPIRDNSQGINKLTFQSFLNLPGILGDRVFDMCSSGDGKQKQVTLVEFRKVMQKVFYSRVETKLNLVFDILDFNNDSLITIEDIRLVLSHIPLVQTKPKFIDRLRS